MLIINEVPERGSPETTTILFFGPDFRLNIITILHGRDLFKLVLYDTFPTGRRKKSSEIYAYFSPGQIPALHVKYTAVTAGVTNLFVLFTEITIGGCILANKASAIKRIRQNEKRRLRNRVYRGNARTQVKNAQLAIEEGNVEEAREATLKAISALDIAAQKGTIHKKNAGRRKSRLMKKLAAIEESK
jgi:small subunit ribosomal protein S20